MAKVYDYSRCKFDPTTVKLYDLYPDLFETMGPHCPDERMVKYIIAMYDPASPLIMAESNLEKRRLMAFEAAGYLPVVDEVWMDKWAKLEDDELIEAIVHYLFSFTHNRTWQKVVVNEQLYMEYTKRLLVPVKQSGTNDKEKDELQAYQIKAKLREELDQISNSLDQYYKQLFGGDEQLIKKSKKRYTPEDMAMGR